MIKEIRKVKCVDFTFDGQGLAKDEKGRTVFVPSLLVDEVADVEIQYRKKDYDIGKIVKLIELSKYRIKPKCPCSTSCGGCTFQNRPRDSNRSRERLWDARRPASPDRRRSPRR